MRVLLPFLCYRYEVQLYHCLYWNLKFSFNFTFIGVRIFSVPVAGCIGQQKLVSCWKVGQLLKYWSAGEKLVSCINIGQQMLVSCWKVGQQKLVSCWNIGQLLWVSSSAQASHWRRKQPWQCAQCPQCPQPVTRPKMTHWVAEEGQRCFSYNM